MPIIYKDYWKVIIGKEKFILDGEQINILKEAMKKGERWVSFKKFILSIPHIECIFFDHRDNTVKYLPGENTTGVDNLKSFSEEEWAKFKKDVYSKVGK